MNFRERLQHIITQKNSLLCVGLDPDKHKLPESLKSEPEALFAFCKRIIEQTAEAAAAFKLNFAFFEAAGAEGWHTLENLRETIPSDVLVIADAKRGDIGHSSRMYARAILERLDFDAVTVNPYMGRDSVAPFLEWPEKGAFILCLTSNPGSHDFQRLQTGTKMLFENVVREVQNWNERGNCGLVVGATHPEELAQVRQMAPELPFLIPGIGAQGGSVADAVRAGTDSSGGLALFNASRSIIYKSNGEDFAEAAGQEAARLRDEINEYLT